ncbi:hypothetical protein IMCC3135_30560 [Granulosicoccus antarcticus IMCC3135]|uniref:Uncharacterized protein n=1 Tax=Granulosicoccus antarcticus IMCC3135 TaxID=1192854 RepID=A0A2Z2P149_9GAMM|nr:hypothetical protein IMCC3135_30560 [Granulosicoccus antarcticus IMCC3135]
MLIEGYEPLADLSLNLFFKFVEFFTHVTY